MTPCIKTDGRPSGPARSQQLACFYTSRTRGVSFVFYRFGLIDHFRIRCTPVNLSNSSRPFAAQALVAECAIRSSAAVDIELVTYPPAFDQALIVADRRIADPVECGRKCDHRGWRVVINRHVDSVDDRAHTA